jgi:hypothetical protein
MEERGGCGLLQLEHTYSSIEMYGSNYGYRSGLNSSMVDHLHGTVNRIREKVNLVEGDIVLDVGSNDGTTLQAYPRDQYTLVGIDPTGQKFKYLYPKDALLIPEFFSENVFNRTFGGRKAKVITSFAMFYDLENPLEFMRQVSSVLDDEGIWVFEQSYMPAMLAANAYDTVCHEHLEYYSLKQIKWMADRVGLKIVDISFNDINGGSVCVSASKNKSIRICNDQIQAVLNAEREMQLHELAPYYAFADRVYGAKSDLLRFIDGVRANGKTVAALGASTKGNVLMQFCELSDKDIAYIGEVNQDKYGCFTPGTWIPIISEDELIANNPDYAIVMPWHFKNFFIKNRDKFPFHLVFPLPKLEII